MGPLKFQLEMRGTTIANFLRHFFSSCGPILRFWHQFRYIFGDLGVKFPPKIVIFGALGVTLGTFQSLLSNLIGPWMKITSSDSAQGQLWPQNGVPFGAFFSNQCGSFSLKDAFRDQFYNQEPFVFDFGDISVTPGP